MKTKILSILALAIGLFSCSDDTWEPTTNNEGELRLSDLSVEVNTAENARSRAEGDATVDVSDFIVTIMQGEEQKQQWKYAEMPEVVTLPVGKYTIMVKSHEVQKAEFDKPYYLSAPKEFEIEAKKITSIGSVECIFSSVKTTVNIADDLLEYLGDDYKVTIVASEDGSLTFTKDEIATPDKEGKAGYFEALEQSMTLVATFTGTVNGEQATIRYTKTDVKAGNYYKITYSLKGIDVDIPEQIGSIGINGITINTETTDVNDMNIPVDLTEEVITPEHQRPGQEGNMPGEEIPDTPDQPGEDDAIIFKSKTKDINLESINDANNFSGEAVVIITANEGITNLLVEIESDNSEFIDAVGDLMPTKFDLANPESTDLEESLSSIGFPVGNEVKGQPSADFDITTFVPLLKSFPGNHTFTITVVDTKGNIKTLELKFKA